MSGNGGTIYAPLKQAFSDSDSEDEKLEDATHLRADNHVDFNSGLQSKNFSASDLDDFNTNANTVESTMDNGDDDPRRGKSHTSSSPPPNSMVTKRSSPETAAKLLPMRY